MRVTDFSYKVHSHVSHAAKAPPRPRHTNQLVDSLRGRVFKPHPKGRGCAEGKGCTHAKCQEFPAAELAITSALQCLKDHGRVLRSAGDEPRCNFSLSVFCVHVATLGSTHRVRTVVLGWVGGAKMGVRAPTSLVQYFPRGVSGASITFFYGPELGPVVRTTSRALSVEDGEVQTGFPPNGPTPCWRDRG